MKKRSHIFIYQTTLVMFLNSLQELIITHLFMHQTTLHFFCMQTLRKTDISCHFFCITFKILAKKKKKYRKILTVETLPTTSGMSARPRVNVRTAMKDRVSCRRSLRGTSPKGLSCSMCLLTHSMYESLNSYCTLTSRNMRSRSSVQKSASMSSRLTALLPWL